MTSKSKSIGVNLKELKLSGVSDLSFSSGSIVGSGGSTSAKKEFDDVLSVHGGDEWARTWSVQNKKMGKNTFVIPDEKERQTSGAAKVGLSCVISHQCVAMLKMRLLSRQAASLLAATSVSSATNERNQYTCGICSPASTGGRSSFHKAARSPTLERGMSPASRQTHSTR